MSTTVRERYEVGDLDHTNPYNETGPPGQTSPHNLAALCRRHHRAKTTGRWRYLRTPDGDYLWHGPTTRRTWSLTAAPNASDRREPWAYRGGLVPAAGRTRRAGSMVRSESGLKPLSMPQMTASVRLVTPILR